MKKFLILVVLISVVIYFAGCTQETKDEEPGAADNKETKDEKKDELDKGEIEVFNCGEDSDCFDEKLKACEPATFEAGFGPEAMFLFTVKGFEGENCLINTLVTVNPDQKFQGTFYDCLVPKESLGYKEYSDWVALNLMDSCTGTFIDTMNHTMNCPTTSMVPGIAVTRNDVTVKVTEIGSNDEITVEVYGVTETIAHLETKTVNGVKIKNIAIENGMAEMEINCGN
ncbi:MAG: hypothetical protein ABH986_05575 [archaeon]